MTSARLWVVLFNVVVVIVWLVMAVVVYDALPMSIPTHFGASGAADAYATRSIATWFALPAIGATLTVLLLWLAHVVHRKPSLLNMPGKEQLLALAVDKQQPLLGQVAMFMSLLATSTLLLFVAIHYDSWRVAMSAQRGLSAVSWTALALSIGGMTIGIPLWMVRFQRDVKAASAAVAASARRMS